MKRFIITLILGIVAIVCFSNPIQLRGYRKAFQRSNDGVNFTVWSLWEGVDAPICLDFQNKYITVYDINKVVYRLQSSETYYKGNDCKKMRFKFVDSYDTNGTIRVIFYNNCITQVYIEEPYRITVYQCK